MTLVKALCLSLFMICLAARGQESAPLREVLAHIEQAHGVRFSFIEDEIVVYRLVPPQKNWTLAQKLNYLEKETRLRLRNIGDG